jgi:hypothetical protein
MLVGAIDSFSKGQTHHVPPQIILLLSLESPQILHHADTRVLGILLCNTECLLELHQAISRLADLVSPRLLRVDVCHASEGVCD